MTRIRLRPAASFRCDESGRVTVRYVPTAYLTGTPGQASQAGRARQQGSKKSPANPNSTKNNREVRQTGRTHRRQLEGSP